MPEARRRIPDLRRQLAGDRHPVFAISAVTREGIPELLDAILEILAEARKGQGAKESGLPHKPPAELPVLRPKPERRGIAVERQDGVFVITSPEVTRVAAMVDESNWTARTQFYRLLERMGAVKQLEKMGVKPGDRVRAGKLEWEWE
jgi:GTP-binding protein